MRRMASICAVVALACASETSTPRRPAWVDPQPAGGEVPVGMPGIAFSSPGGYTWDGALAPGSGSFTGAPLWDWESTEEPSAFGGGSFDVTIDGVRYQSSAAESFSALVDDGLGEYLVLGAVVFAADEAQVLYVVTPRADFAPGASVAIDGSERLALFAAGSTDADAPEVVAAAASGTITFGGGGLAAGGAVSASVSGDFGRIAWDDAPPGDDPPADVTAGVYHLTVGAAVEVQCDGTMAGQESSYAAIAAADAGFSDGDVTISGAVTLEGDVLLDAFGATSLALEWQGGAWQGWGEVPAAGPLGVDRAGAMLALVPGERLGVMLAAVFGDDSGWCVVHFGAVLAP